MSVQLPFKEGDTVVELGGGERPLIKQIQGLKSVNVDIRPLPEVDVVRNLEEDFSDIGQFDGLFANYLLEHISWRKVPHFLEQCAKILKPGACAFFVVPDTYAQMQKVLQKKPEDISLEDSCFIFGGQDFSDNTHKWLISRPFLKKLLNDAGFDEVRFISHPNSEARDVFVEAYRGDSKVAEEKVKLNLGSFTVTYGHGWINCDIRADIKPVVEAKGHIFEYCDVTKPLRWGDNTVDVIVAHHLIEHLDRREGDLMLRECLRVLKPGGVIRLGTPDLEMFIRMLPQFKVAYQKEYEVQHSEDDADAFFRLAFMGHKTIYTYESLRKKMDTIGFTDIKRVQAGESRSNAVLIETVDSFPDHSFYIEATKGGSPPTTYKEERTPVITVREKKQPYQQYLDDEIKGGSQDAG